MHVNYVNNKFCISFFQLKINSQLLSCILEMQNEKKSEQETYIFLWSVQIIAYYEYFRQIWADEQ